MPYTSYTYMTDDDALAIKAYLFSLPAVHAEAPQNTLIVSVQPALGDDLLVGRCSIPTRASTPDTSKTPEWNRGAYLAEALAHCGECHTPRNLAFALDNREKFAGARDGGLARLQYLLRQSHRRRRLERRRTGLLSFHRTCRRSRHASGPMGEAVDHSFSHLPPKTSARIVAYLRSVPPSRRPICRRRLRRRRPLRTRTACTADARGKMVFASACVSCHGWTGESPVSPMATLTGAWAVNDPAATNVAQIVISGTKRHTPDGALSMPAFGERLYR